MAKYIYQYNNWPQFTWDEQEIQVLLGKVRHLQGKLFGQMSALGFSLKEETILSTLTLDVLKSSEIEGEELNYEQVRSSIARRLGIDYAGMIYSGRDVEGVVEMMLDATQNYLKPLDEERLFGWQAALFPTGRSGMQKIDVGCYRSGEMQVVSGPMGKEKIHYQAPHPSQVKSEMDVFLNWLIYKYMHWLLQPQINSLQAEHSALSIAIGMKKESNYIRSLFASYSFSICLIRQVCLT